jgi:hypothetical protein
MIINLNYKEPVYWIGKYNHVPVYGKPLEMVIETCDEDYDLDIGFDEYASGCGGMGRDYLEEITLNSYTLQSLNVRISNQTWGEISFRLQDGKFVLFENGGNDEYREGMTIEQVFCVFNLGNPLDTKCLKESLEEAVKEKITLEEGYS